MPSEKPGDNMHWSEPLHKPQRVTICNFCYSQASHELDSTPPATDCSLEMVSGAQSCIFGKICAAFCREGFLCRLCSPLSLDWALKHAPAKLRSSAFLQLNSPPIQQSLLQEQGQPELPTASVMGEGVVTGASSSSVLSFLTIFHQLSELQASNLSYQSLFQHYTNKWGRVWKQSQAKEGQKASSSSARPLLRTLLLE